MIVAFFGPDGVGKTTLAKLLARYLLSRGFNVYYVRFKAHHLGMYLLIKFLQQIGIIRNINSPRILNCALKRYFNKSKMFVYFELLNGIVWLLLNIKLKALLTGKKIIVAERYIPDFITSTLLISPNKNTFNRLLRILKPFAHGVVFIFLYANVSDILKRKREELLSYSYIKTLLHAYMFTAIFINVDLHLNTSKYDINKSFYLVKKIINSKVKQNT